jgi:hypothetical protein
MLRFQTRGFGRRAQFERLPTKDFTGFVPWCCLRHGSGTSAIRATGPAPGCKLG